MSTYLRVHYSFISSIHRLSTYLCRYLSVYPSAFLSYFRLFAYYPGCQLGCPSIHSFFTINPWFFHIFDLYKPSVDLSIHSEVLNMQVTSHLLFLFLLSRLRLMAVRNLYVWKKSQYSTPFRAACIRLVSIFHVIKLLPFGGDAVKQCSWVRGQAWNQAEHRNVHNLMEVIVDILFTFS